MSRKFFFTLFIFSLGYFHFCEAQNKFVLPDTLITHKQQDQIRIIGTKLFIEIPAGFNYIKPFSIIKKNKETFIQIKNAPGKFSEMKKMMAGDLLSRSKDHKVEDTASKSFIFNGTQAFYVCAIENSGWGMIMIVGDDKSSFAIMGTCNGADKDAIKNIQKVISTVYYDNNLELDAAELSYSIIDIKKTNFKLLAVKSYGTAFSKEGKGNFNELPEQTQIFVRPIHEISDTIVLRYMAEDLLGQYTNRGYEIKNSNKKYIVTIESNPMWEIVYKAEFKGQKIEGYIAVTGNENGSIIFLGVAFEDLDANIKTFRSLAKSIKLE